MFTDTVMNVGSGVNDAPDTIPRRLSAWPADRYTAASALQATSASVAYDFGKLLRSRCDADLIAFATNKDIANARQAMPADSSAYTKEMQRGFTGMPLQSEASLPAYLPRSFRMQDSSRLPILPAEWTPFGKFDYVARKQVRLSSSGKQAIHKFQISGVLNTKETFRN